MPTAVSVMVRGTIGAVLRCRTAAGAYFSALNLARNPVDPKSRLPSSFGKGLTERTVYPAYPFREKTEDVAIETFISCT
jgi:hypothetical protein